jgi:hypothetical protein
MGPGDAILDGEIAFGTTEPLTTRVASVLEDFADVPAVLRELILNAVREPPCLRVSSTRRIGCWPPRGHQRGCSTPWC